MPALEMSLPVKTKLTTNMYNNFFIVVAGPFCLVWQCYRVFNIANIHTTVIRLKVRLQLPYVHWITRNTKQSEYQHVRQSINQPINQSININTSINRSILIHQSININTSINILIKKSINQYINQLINMSVMYMISQTFNQHTKQSINLSTNQSVSQSNNQTCFRLTLIFESKKCMWWHNYIVHAIM